MPAVIAAADVEDRLDWLAMTEALASGHRLPPARITDQVLTRGDQTLLVRAAWIDGLGLGVKSVTIFPGNPADGRPSVQGGLSVFDDATGTLEAILDSDLVTRWKTAADSLLAARLLARPGSRRLLILGAGAVAAALIDAYRAGFPGIEITLWNRTAASARALAERTGASVAEDLPAAVAVADIVATATLATTPVLHGAWLRPGQHLDLIGAFRADMREADDAALTRARIFVDSRDTTLGAYRRAQGPARPRRHHPRRHPGRPLRPRRRPRRPRRSGRDHPFQKRRRRAP